MRNILFAVLIGAFLMVGTASADRGVWINSGDYADPNSASTGGWITFFHIGNTGSSTITATVQLYAKAGGTSVLASTTRVLAPNALWDFLSAGLGQTSTLSGDFKGVVVVTPDTGTSSVISAYFTGTASGFNFRQDD